MKECRACAAGPTGIEGHEALFVETMDRGQMQFKCRTCGALWQRRYSGQGAFEWRAMTELAKGSGVPRAG